MVDQKVVGNLELGTDLEVDNPEARTETGVDLEVCTESGVDLEVCTVLEVAPQMQIVYLEVAPQALIEATPQAITDHLEVEYWE